jgi:NAD dependent epimerase/dehydratase family enzyme
VHECELGHLSDQDRQYQVHRRTRPPLAPAGGVPHSRRAAAPRGQRVLPNKALSNGFVFGHETLRSAFEAIL